MAKLSEKYEAVVVFSLKNGEDAVKALVAKFSDLIKEHGTLVDVDEWGARKLAYEINYETDGYYVVYSFDSKPCDNIEEIGFSVFTLCLKSAIYRNSERKHGSTRRCRSQLKVIDNPAHHNYLVVHTLSFLLSVFKP